MVNLHSIANQAITAINPNTLVTIRRSLGTYTTLPDGTRVPDYVVLSGQAQVQDLSADQLSMIEGLNQQGLHKNIYLNGSWAGVIRADARGGDLFYFDGHEWLITMVSEQWPDWAKVVVTQQSPVPAPLPGAPFMIGFGAIGVQSIG